MRVVRSSDVEATADPGVGRRGADQGVGRDTERRGAGPEEERGVDHEGGTEIGVGQEGEEEAVLEGETVAARGGEIEVDQGGETVAAQGGVREVDPVAEREAGLEAGREVIQRIEEGIAQERGVAPEGERNEEIQKHKEEDHAVDQEVERERRMQASYLEHWFA